MERRRLRLGRRLVTALAMALLVAGACAAGELTETPRDPDGESDGSGDGGDTGGGTGGGMGGGDPAGTLSEQYPGDAGIGADPSVLFHSDFESGFDGWTDYTSDPDQLDVLTDGALAHAGTGYLRARVTRSRLNSVGYAAAAAQFEFPRRVPEMYWRFYARFVGETATPHHWVRVAAGIPGWGRDGIANTVPDGGEGFWFDLDTNTDQLWFYVYWHEMRSSRCNDGSATPGCEGDQGTTNYYGNNFVPAGQPGFSRDEWICIEIRTRVNTVGEYDGELSLWMNDALLGEYRTGEPRGRWLRDNFFSWGPYFRDDQAFEGFNFRTDSDVLLKRVTLDAYYQSNTIPASAPEENIILYDDVVVAESRIGCRVP